MNVQNEGAPKGLTRRQMEHLAECSRRAVALGPAALMTMSESHLAMVRAASSRNRLINTRLATALSEKFGLIVLEWERLPESARPWLAGAMLYFSSEEDEEPDLSSPIGFEDDVAVLNACLRLASLEEHCLRAEDFDDG